MKRRVHIHVGDSSLATWGKLGAAGPSTPERVLQTLLPGSVQVHLHQSQTLARSGAVRDADEFTVGQRVTMAGYPGVIVRKYSEGMYEVRLKSGVGVYPKGDLKPDPSFKRVALRSDDAQRLIDTITDGSAVAKIYRDVEWEEFVVKLYVNGVYQSKADYHTDDKSDATSSAREMVRRAKENARDSSAYTPPVPAVGSKLILIGGMSGLEQHTVIKHNPGGTITLQGGQIARRSPHDPRTWVRDCGCTDTCDCMNYDAAFSSSMIEQLRSEYSKIDKVDPEGESFKKLRALLDRLDQEQLKQLAGAGIKFVSNLARNRVQR